MLYLSCYVMQCMFVKCPAHSTSDYLGKLYIVLVIVSSFVFPQVGGLSALQRSRVGSLLPISTPTVVHGMTWSWAPQKPGKVSHCKLSCRCERRATRQWKQWYGKCYFSGNFNTSRQSSCHTHWFICHCAQSASRQCEWWHSKYYHFEDFTQWRQSILL